MNEIGQTDDLLTEVAIIRALESVRARISRAELARRAAEDEIGKSREEERLLKRLLALRSTTSALSATPLLEPDDSEPAAEPQSKAPAVKAAVEELEASGRPLHISELMRLLRGRDVPIPGAGEQANLIAHMSRDSRIARPSRGMYALASWGIEAIPTTKLRRRKRIRVTAK
jgi:hypothetical protein